MNIAEIPKEDIKGLECRHATYAQSRFTDDDLLVVKEYVHLNDGRRIPNVRLIKNFKREFWVTKEGYRKHTDKLEWDEEKHLQRYETTQAKLSDAIARALGKPGVRQPLKQLARSPYLYGCDIGTPPLLKRQYATRWPDCVHPVASVAVMDVETDVVRGTNDIDIITLSFKDKVFTAVTKAYVGTMVNPIDKIMQACDKYIKEYIDKRQIKLDVLICETPAEACAAAIAKAHEWTPDFIIFWNMNFDLPRIMTALEKGGYDLADVFSDPKVPNEYRFFKYREGKAQKITQSGKVIPLHPADRWHIAESPASFYFLDAMCLYKRIRTAKGNEPSYSLDYTLKKNLGLTKLKFSEADHITNGLEWHQFMQTNYKAEYVAYNIFDCISVEMLDEKTGDVCRAFSVLCEYSDFSNFTSTPRRISDDLHFFCRENGLVIATTSTEMTDELDDHVVDMKGWIVTLPAHLTADNGLRVIKELPNVRSMIHAQLADLDIEGTYPTVEDIMNISKETTYRELSKIHGMPEVVQREIGINLTGGPVNAVEICQAAFKLPAPDAWVELHRQSRQKNNDSV